MCVTLGKHAAAATVAVLTLLTQAGLDVHRPCRHLIGENTQLSGSQTSPRVE